MYSVGDIQGSEAWRRTAEAAARRSAAHGHAAGRRTRLAIEAAAPALAGSLVAKEVEPVDEVEHGEAVDAVILRVAAAHCRHCAAEIALVCEDVIELQRDGEGFALEEALRHLCVPHEFVGVHGVVAVAAPAVLVKVGGEGGAPGTGDVHCAAVGKLPCVEVCGLLKVVARVHVLQRAVEFHLEPTVAEIGRAHV